jgi:hypothetical protein
MNAKMLMITLLSASTYFAIPAQTVSEPQKPVAATPPALPFPTQVKKTVVFVTTQCLHEPTADERKDMTPEKLANLNPGDRAEWQIELDGNLTPEAFAQMTGNERSRIRMDNSYGTGFIVFMPDDRAGKDRGFQYLVTNRHVVEPGIDHGKKCDVLQRFISLNHKTGPAGSPSRAQQVVVGLGEPWHFSDDPSVDIAVMPVMILETDWDYRAIPITMFATQDMVTGHEIVEGDPVIFAGLFYQYVGSSKLEPVVRSGSIAMLPDDLIPTTLGLPGRVYLAEAHAFGGNSGSPIFVDVNKFKNVVGFDYRLLGVVTGEIFENSNFTFQVAASYSGNVPANSDVSVVVPADQVRSILLSAQLQAERDKAIAIAGNAKATTSQ